ncbi:MAG: helix-turn-helix domain-containing protein [Clostridiales bacterium]|nr:helix-turn-helix domain-containing protein [Clostridiales bacterium]
MEYNERIKQLRIQKNITQQQLADEIGVSRQSVVRWENGLSVPSMYYAQRLAEYFGITVTGLMTGFDDLPKVAKPDSDMRVKRGTSTIRFCLTAFLIVVVYALIINVIQVVSYSNVQAGNDSVTVRSVFAMINAIIDGLAVVAMAVALAMWISRLVVWLSASDDRFTWYGIYKKWMVGLAAWLVNMLTVVLLICMYIMPIVFLYAMAAVIAIPIYCIIDFALKKALSDRMIVAGNKTLKIINSIFCAIISCGVVALIAWIVYAVATFRPTYGLEVAFAVLYFCIAAVVVIISYIITRLILHRVTTRHMNYDAQK